MKKLSMLIALLLCLTIGGVYATWTYTATLDEVDIVDKKYEAKAILADAEVQGAAGTFTIESNLVLKIDQNAPGDHSAKLVFESDNAEEPMLKISFKPDANAPEEVKENAVQAELYFTLTSEMNCATDQEGHFQTSGEATPIFKIADAYASNGTLDNLVNWGTADTNGVFSVTYTVDQLDDIITLNKPIILDTKEDYTAFAALLSGNIAANITDGTVNGGTQG